MTELTGTGLLVAAVIKVLSLFTLLLVLVALATYVERRVAGFIQDRSGPNRVGPIGLLQAVADGLKSLLKEERAWSTCASYVSARRLRFIHRAAWHPPGAS